MGYRSGFTLTALLRETRELTPADEVHRHIDAALEFATARPDSRGHRYQRGQQLVDHLRNGSVVAGQLGYADVSDRLTDFAEYAAGEIPLALLETWYLPTARKSGEKLVRMTLEIGLRRSAELLAEYVKDVPEATADDARRWLDQVARSMERWTIGEDRLGGVKLPRQSRDHLTWLSRIQITLDHVSGQRTVSPEIAEELAQLPGSELIADAVELRKRREALDRLRLVVEDPDSTERYIHDELHQQVWIFGGRYVSELRKRRLTAGAEVDIPLLRGDGSVHVVELKRANIRRLVEQPRSHPSVGIDVHRAVTQAANYLRSLDEERARILANYGIECRRAFATVLVGHSKFIAPPFSAKDVTAAFKTYNASLNRIEVLTYDELVNSAERTLSFESGNA